MQGCIILGTKIGADRNHIPTFTDIDRFVNCRFWIKRDPRRRLIGELNVHTDRTRHGAGVSSDITLSLRPVPQLEISASICDDSLYIESAILDDFSPYRGGMGNGYSGGQVVAEFYPEDQYGGNTTNWWVPTLHCMGFMARAAGFTDIEGWKLVDTPATLSLCRGFIRASRNV